MRAKRCPQWLLGAPSGACVAVEMGEWQQMSPRGEQSAPLRRKRGRLAVLRSHPSKTRIPPLRWPGERPLLLDPSGPLVGISTYCSLRALVLCPVAFHLYGAGC